MWQIESAPPHGFQVDEKRLAALDLLNRMVLHSMTVVGKPGPEPGAAIELNNSRNQCRTLWHIFDRYFVDPQDGRLSLLTDDGELIAIDQLPAETLQQYPKADASDIERAIWAAQVKARHLLERYPRPAGNAEGDKTVRGMFDALRTRAAKLLR